jgi:tellurite resistance protein TerC
MPLQSVGTPALWLAFAVLVLGVLALDLGVFHRQEKTLGLREAFVWTCVWIGLSFAFNVGVYFWFGQTAALEFLAGYLIEQALSVDNIFVFLVIFSYFAVPANLQHRVLFWGILGAIVMRAIFIVVGISLLSRFHALIYVFGAFLVFTGVKLLLQHETEVHPERNPVVRLFSKLVRTVSDYRGKRFFVKENGRWHATPLLTVVFVIEASDVVFAVDSIPAIFGITLDPFIVYTSNIFAILGLRSFFALLAILISAFRHLHYGLAFVLTFIGVKMLLPMFEVHIGVGTSLSVVLGAIALSIVTSLLRPPKPPEAPPTG